MWYRVFGTNEVQPQPAAFLEFLQSQGFSIRGDFRGDDDGWFEARLTDSDAEDLEINCYLAAEEGLRADLNSWAAWLETAESPDAQILMQRVIGTRRIFTIRKSSDEEDEANELSAAVCRFLARETGGFYQVDGGGFFSADGTLLVKE